MLSKTPPTVFTHSPITEDIFDTRGESIGTIKNENLRHLITHFLNRLSEYEQEYLEFGQQELDDAFNMMDAMQFADSESIEKIRSKGLGAFIDDASNKDELIQQFKVQFDSIKEIVEKL